MKILFLTTAHHYDDDRIFYHQAKELISRGYTVKICSLTKAQKSILDGIEIEAFDALTAPNREKTNCFVRVAQDFSPDVIICSEPLAVVAAKRFQKIKKTSIIYDITEWYPMMTMLAPYRGITKVLHFIKFVLIQIFASFCATHFIFGEETKKFPLAQLFPFKKRIILPYYPDEKYVKPRIKTLDKDKITLCYTGAISEDKGIGNFFAAINQLQLIKPELQTDILIIGSARTPKDQKYFDQILEQYAFKNIHFKKPTAYENFTEAFAEADICFDLRAFNYENHHSLPIKLFYYMGAGKPIIYSDLKAIRQHLDVSSFGALVHPENSHEIAQQIIHYIENPQRYREHAETARKEFEKHYNWNLIKNRFVDFVNQSIKK